MFVQTPQDFPYLYSKLFNLMFRQFLKIWEKNSYNTKSSSELKYKTQKEIIKLSLLN